MNLTTLPGDWLQDIFVHWDFATQCRFRRSCRRWNQLLRSRFVLRNMVVHVPVRRPSRDYASLKEAIAPVVQNVYLIDPAPFTIPVPYKDAGRQHATIRSLLRIFGDRPGRQRRLLLQNLEIWPPFFVTPWAETVDSMEFRMISLTCDAVLHVFSNTRIYKRWIGTTCARLNPNSRREEMLAVKVVGSNNMTCPLRLTTFRELILHSMRPLDANQLQKLADQLRHHESARLREAVTVVLAEYQPDLRLKPGQDLTYLYGQFAPVVCRLLFCWDGGVYRPSVDDDEIIEDSKASAEENTVA